MSDSVNLDEKLYELMRSKWDGTESLMLPPPVFKTLGGKVIALDLEAKTLTKRFPVQAKYQNPLGFMQGGIIAALIDNTVGPLAVLVAPPSVTTHFFTTYIRPVTPQDEIVTVFAEVVEQTRRTIMLRGRAYNAAGKTLVLGEATQRVVERP